MVDVADSLLLGSWDAAVLDAAVLDAVVSFLKYEIRLIVYYFGHSNVEF